MFRPLILFFLLAFVGSSYGEERRGFILIMEDHDWQGMRPAAKAGDVEEFTHIERGHFVLWHPEGRSFGIPQVKCREITAERAVRHLLKKRDWSMSPEAVARSETAPAPTAPPKRLSRAERQPMERAVWKAGLTRNLFLAKKLTDRQLRLLYKEAQKDSSNPDKEGGN